MRIDDSITTPKDLIVDWATSARKSLYKPKYSHPNWPNFSVPLTRLFHPFFTTKATTANGNEPVGTGLGLYMIKCLMEPYDAEIGVESTIDVGTTFRLKIPRTKKPS